MFADYEYYTGCFGGTIVENEKDFNYFSRQASRYILRHTDIVNDATKDCECALVEYLMKSDQQGNMTSESIPNAYSVSWSANDSGAKLKEINSVLELYLGDLYCSSVGIVKVIN